LRGLLSKLKTLITTAFKATWRAEEDVIYLGEWCKKYDKSASWNGVHIATLPYHWDNKQKLSEDYVYLKELYEDILFKLSCKLNDIHDVSFSQRYWRIVLGPWLSSYVAAVWDRWESINKAVALGEPLRTIVPDNHQITRVVPNDYLSSIRIMSTSEDWNYLLYCSILRWQKSANITLVEKPITSFEVSSPYNAPERNSRVLSKLANLCDKLVNKLWFTGNYKCVAFKSFLSPAAFTKLSIRLRQPVRTFSEFERKVVYSSSLSKHRSDSHWFTVSGDFEAFLCQQINKDIPRAYLEDFEKIRSAFNAAGSRLKTKLIMTANAHYHNEVFKIWTAGMVDQGSQLIIAAHGGAMRGKFDTFGHEEDISDFKTTWHVPIHPKHIQLSPNKSISKNIHRGEGQHITVIGLDSYRYANRFPTGPISSTILVGYRQQVELIKSMTAEGIKDVVVRPYANPWGWASRERFIDELGKEFVSDVKSIKEELLNSKIAICTYPQTTFSEAMHIGVPTLLMYDEETWTLHDEFLPLLEEMRRVGIFHTSASSAALHIKTIYEHPLRWWDSEETKAVRSKFDEVCGTPSKNISIDREWGAFFTNVLGAK